MTKAGRIALGREWKRKLIANKEAGKKLYVVPRQVTMRHPYILEGELPISKKGSK